MRKEEIVFVVNPSLWVSNMYPTGILSLSAYLEKRGLPSTILDSALGPPGLAGAERERAILERIGQLKPRLVCFSSTHREFDEVVRMNRAVKELDGGIQTIVGGAQPTYRSADFLAHGFDFVGVGEGEATLYEFAGEILGGQNRFRKINGLHWRAGQEIVANPPRALLTEEELNDIPALPYDQLDRRYFEIDLRMIRGLPLRGALLMTTRGCPFSCSYCGCNLIFGRKLRAYSLAHIEAEVCQLKERHGVEGIWIGDDTFTVRREHALGVAAILKKHRLIWGCQTRVNTVDEDLMRTMKEAGCVQIDFGVESGSQRVLDEIIGKGTKVAQVEQAFRLAKKVGLRTLANFMVGLPTESRADLGQTEALASRLGADVYVFSIATPLPGTRLYEMVNEEITPQEYSMLDWNGSPLMDKIDKSHLGGNLSGERQRLENKFFLSSVVKTLFAGSNYSFFFSRAHKLERMRCVTGYLAGYLKTRARSPNSRAP